MIELIQYFSKVGFCFSTFLVFEAINLYYRCPAIDKYSCIASMNQNSLIAFFCLIIGLMTTDNFLKTQNSNTI